MVDKKFIVTTKTAAKEDKSVTMTIRIDCAVQEKLDRIAAETNRSRNEIINLALEYAIENAEIESAQKLSSLWCWKTKQRSPKQTLLVS